jgi:hypothetical protein
MSTIKVTNIQHASASTAAIALNSSGQATLNGLNFPTAGALSNRNLIINGAMQVAQRGTQVTNVTTGGYRTCDRFQFAVANLGTWTVDQDTNAPNGFSNSFKVTCTTADASPAAADNLRFLYQVEAQDLQSLGFGTSGAQALTLSFWVRSNKTGNASFGILQFDNSNKQVSFQYNISSADTWEYKTISIPGDTAGVINNDNGSGFQLEWWLNGGSDYSGGSHQSTWSTFAQTNRNPSNLGVGGATSDYFAITGVQLEVGSVATPFEHRSYGDELARCQRYCHAAVADGSLNTYMALGIGRWRNAAIAQIAIQHPVELRTVPTLESNTAASTFHINTDGTFAGASPTGISLNEPGIKMSAINADYSPGGRTVGQATTLYCSNTSLAKLVFSAEL